MSASAELLEVLQEVRSVQEVVGGDLPLLVDEGVHYSTMRLLYSQSF